MHFRKIRCKPADPFIVPHLPWVLFLPLAFPSFVRFLRNFGLRRSLSLY